MNTALENDLNPIFANTVSAMESQIGTSGYTLLKAGIRSGKTKAVMELIERIHHNYAHIIVIDPAASSQAVFEQLEPEIGAKLLSLSEALRLQKQYARNRATTGDEILFVFEEPFWTEGSYLMFRVMCEVGHVIAVGSRGDYYDKSWMTVPALSLATWELNQNITRDDLESHENRMSFERDYFGF